LILQTYTDTHTDTHTQTQTHRHTDTQTHRHTQTHTQTHTETHRHTHTHRHTDRQTHTHTRTHVEMHLSTHTAQRWERYASSQYSISCKFIWPEMWQITTCLQQSINQSKINTTNLATQIFWYGKVKVSQPVSISSTFYEQLLRWHSFAKKVQNQTVIRENQNNFIQKGHL